MPRTILGLGLVLLAVLLGVPPAPAQGGPKPSVADAERQLQRIVKKYSLGAMRVVPGSTRKINGRESRSFDGVPIYTMECEIEVEVLQRCWLYRTGQRWKQPYIVDTLKNPGSPHLWLERTKGERIRTKVGPSWEWTDNGWVPRS